MGRKPKLSKEIKVKACEAYMNNRGSFISIAKAYGVNKESVRRWYYSYLDHGPNVFNYSARNSSYTKEFKLDIIKQYLSGEYSTTDLQVKYGINVGLISKWVRNYYNGIENKNYNPKGEVYTMESRRTTFEERLEIVKWVIDNNMNYKGAADKYQIKYALVYQWVQKYKKDGVKGLEHKKRGPKAKSIIDEDSLSEIEKLKLELDKERKLREHAELTVEILKKKEEFEKKLRSRK